MNPNLPATRTHLTSLSLPDIFELAGPLVKSGLLPSSIRTTEQAVAVILKGQELRIPPMYALSNIVVISGKPTANAELMLALVYRDHGDAAMVVEESTATHCIVAYKRRSWPSPRHYRYTIAEAKQAELTANHTWKKFPAAMLRARCISAVARMAFPDSIGGMYLPDELGATTTVTNDGEIIYDASPPESIEEAEYRDVEPEPLPQPAPQPTRQRTVPGPHNPITKGDADRVRSEARARGWSNDDLVAWLDQHGYERMGQMTYAQLDALKRDIANDRRPNPEAREPGTRYVTPEEMAEFDPDSELGAEAEAVGPVAP